MSKGKRVRAERKVAPPPVGKAQQSDRRLWLAGGGLLAAVIVAVVAFAVTSGGSTSPAKLVNEAGLIGLQAGPAPWQPEIAHLADRLQALGLPALTTEGTVLHIHQHLDLYVDGHAVVVPAGIGINDNSFLSPIHTHDTTGVIHVESPTNEQFSLGQFFAIWGVRFSPTSVGGYRASAAKPIRVYLNGKPVSGDPTRLVLASHQEIAIVIGRKPASLPARYRFSAGE